MSIHFYSGTALVGFGIHPLNGYLMISVSHRRMLAGDHTKDRSGSMRRSVLLEIYDFLLLTSGGRQNLKQPNVKQLNFLFSMEFFHRQARGRWRQASSVLFTHTPLNS